MQMDQITFRGEKNNQSSLFLLFNLQMENAEVVHLIHRDFFLLANNSWNTIHIREI